MANSQSYALVANAIRYLDRHVLQQPSLEDVARALNVSALHLQKVFSAWVGLSPKRFLQFLTKEHAKTILLETDSILSASLDLGLSSPSRLHDLMVNCEAMTPAQVKKRGDGIDVVWGRGVTPFGDATLAWTSKGICHLSFDTDHEVVQVDTELTLRQRWPSALLSVDHVQAQQQLHTIFRTLDQAPTPQRPPLHLWLQGTNFQIKVWEALMQVPEGHMISYQQLATQAGSPRAARAVGSAMAANGVAFLIPCHRVIRETGDVGHYRWGRERKQAMLGWEAARRFGGERPKPLDE